MADTLTGFVDQVNAPASSFSALASTSSPSLADFNASSSSEALKWTDLVQDVVSQILLLPSMFNLLFCLSRKLMDLAVVLGHMVCRRKRSCRTL